MTMLGKKLGEHFLQVILLLYLIAFLVLLPYYQYQIDPDGIAYIGIAQKYLTGNFQDAINTHWPPLFSWLIIPLLFTLKEGLLATKALSLFIGAASIVGVWLLFLQFRISKSVRIILIPALVPICLFYSLSVSTPDLLFVCILIFYLVKIFDPKYETSTKNALICGILGGAASLTKAYGFCFFITHFSLFNILYHKRTFKNLLVGLLVFFLINLLWTTILTVKSRYFSFGILNYGSFASAFIGSGIDPENAFFNRGFMTPSNETATSVWENPLVQLPFLKPWNPLESKETINYQIRLIKSNIAKTIFALNSYTFLWPFILIWAVFNSKKGHFPLLLTLAMFFPYIFINVDPRYLWTVALLLLLTTGLLLTSFGAKSALTFFCMLTFTLTPTYFLITNRNTSYDLYLISRKLREEFGVQKGSKLASNGEWGAGMALAYHLESQYFGQAKPNTNKNELINQLEYFDIDYYLVWNNFEDKYSSLGEFEEITNHQIPNLRVFDLKKDDL